MSAAYAKTTFPDEMFSSAREKMETMVAELQSPKMLAAEHSELERSCRRRGASCNGDCTRPISIFARRASVRCPCAAVTAWNAPTGVRAGARSARSWDGCTVSRLAYQALGVEGLHPMDAALNLPPELYSHGVRRFVAEHAAMMAFDDVVRELRRPRAWPSASGRSRRWPRGRPMDFDAFYDTPRGQRRARRHGRPARAHLRRQGHPHGARGLCARRRRRRPQEGRATSWSRG